MKILRDRKTYKSCDDLPLSNFIKIVVHNDLSQLYSEKARFIHKQVDLVSIWEHIFNEYNELTNNTQSMHILSLMKEITVLNNKIEIINSAIKCLLSAETTEGYEPLKQMLNGMGFRFSYSDETLENDCKITLSSMKSIIMQKDEAIKEYNEIAKDDGKKVTEADYTSLIAQLAKYMCFHIDKYKTTVTEFISYINAFNSQQDGSRTN